MLVLRRKVKERIFIGENVELVVVSVRGNRVKLGICAPGEVPIRRDEIQPNGQADNPVADDARAPATHAAFLEAEQVVTDSIIDKGPLA